MANAEEEAGWAPELMWTVFRGDVSPLLESEPQYLRHPAHSLQPEQCHTVLAVQGNTMPKLHKSRKKGHTRGKIEMFLSQNTGQVVS